MKEESTIIDPNISLKLPKTISQGNALFGRKLNIEYLRICKCPPNHLNCMTPKEWLKSQLGVWQFNFEKRDIRDKDIHPATFPIYQRVFISSAFFGPVLFFLL